MPRCMSIWCHPTKIVSAAFVHFFFIGRIRKSTNLSASGCFSSWPTFASDEMVLVYLDYRRHEWYMSASHSVPHIFFSQLGDLCIMYIWCVFMNRQMDRARILSDNRYISRFRHEWDQSAISNLVKYWGTHIHDLAVAIGGWVGSVDGSWPFL